MKYLLFTSKQVASRNIAQHLIETEFKPISDFKWEWNKFILIDAKAETVLGIVPPKDAEMAVVLSPHRSETGKPCLTAHTTGNWCAKADFGGAPSTLSFANASFMKDFLLHARELNESLGLGFEVCYEADHHGPTVDIPYTFVEVGSSEKEWNNTKACSAVADSVTDALKANKKYDAFFGIGFGHYMPAVTKHSLEGDGAVGHMLPSYAFDCLDSNMFKQAISRNLEGKAKCVAVEKKALSSAQRKKVSGLCEAESIKMELF
jgi:D-aminoacyl-tRNA deacylase